MSEASALSAPSAALLSPVEPCCTPWCTNSLVSVPQPGGALRLLELAVCGAAIAPTHRRWRDQLSSRASVSGPNSPSYTAAEPFPPPPALPTHPWLADPAGTHQHCCTQRILIQNWTMTRSHSICQPNCSRCTRCELPACPCVRCTTQLGGRRMLALHCIALQASFGSLAHTALTVSVQLQKAHGSSAPSAGSAQLAAARGAEEEEEMELEWSRARNS